MIGMAEQITNYMSVIRGILSHFTIEKRRRQSKDESTMRELMRQVESQGYLERADEVAAGLLERGGKVV